jgi:hypothetical protein
MSLIVVAEGHGETEAIRNLIMRIAIADGLALPHIPASGGVLRRTILTPGSLGDACRLAAAKGATALLLTRDADNDAQDDQHGDCPKVRAPEMAEWVRDINLGFPSAVVLFRWEYESMFLAGLESIVGIPLKGPDGIERPGIQAGAAFYGDPDQGPRGAKEWLSEHMPRRVSYKPTTDQLAMTRLLDLQDQRLNELSSFRRLRRALRFLSEFQSTAGAVYPQDGWS